ncbi:MAG: hypothetical protein II843_01350 [Alphaproteobacteria bacterium]|nr:hypothetical protein [Alphaproteobacteria bacterium]
MVDLTRRKDADFKTEDVSSVGVAIGRAGQVAGKMMQGIGNRIAKAEQQEQKEYQSQVQDNIKTETARLNQQQKAFDASDKLIAADMAGRLENDLLRWNLEQRQNNPNYIGSPDHEKAMRDYYAKLSEQYSQGLGEVGKGEFTSKTQNAVNQMIGNDVKWAYQQKIKQGEESAKNIAQSMNDTAGMYGANGDIQGFKESHKEKREKLKDYIEEAAPNGAMPALYELDKKSLVNFYTNMAQTDPNKAKTLLENPELFKETVPEEMVDNVNNIVATSKTQLLNDKLEQVKAGLAETKQNSPAHKEFEKEQKRLEKEIKKQADEDYSEQSIQSIHQELENAVKPVLEKSLGENALIAKQEHEEEKVERFRNFMTLPTPENLKWFEEDNQMSYTPNVENMSEIPEDMKTQKQKNNDLIKNMMKYRENFGNVSMVEISDYKGTKQMFDDLKTVAQTDSDKDGNVDNVLLKSLVALNNAKQQEISETDYNNYQNIVNKALWDRTFKNELNQFINRTENFMPKQFWNKNSNVAFTSNRERLNEKMESKSRDVLSAVLKEWNEGKSGVDVAQMYRDGIQKAYNEVASEALGINMEQVLADYKEYGFSLANINGRDYSFNGVDSNGNPIWKPVDAHGMSTQKFVESAKKVMNKKGE